MSIQYAFPFCAISDLGTPKTVSGTITVSVPSLDIMITKECVIDSRTWQDQLPDDTLTLSMPGEFLFDSEIEFNISATVETTDCLFLFFAPQLIHNQSLDAKVLPKSQQVVDTEFNNLKIWHNLPLRNNQQAQIVLVTYVQETEKTVVGNLADKITFRKTLTYIEQPATKSGMTIDENIEYYLGKDRLKNLYFDRRIPAAWDIPPRLSNTLSIKNSNTTGFFRGDSKTYYYNNLGYRSNIDYTVDLLKDKRIILCLGDSDTFGVGVEYEEIWPTLIQQQTNSVVLNISVPGISNDGITRIGVQTIQTLSNQIDAVLIHYPPMSLREFVSKKYKGGVHTHRNYNLPYEDWWDHIDWQSNNYNFNKNRILLESTCSAFNILFWDLYINREDSKVPYDFVEYGVYSSIGPHTHSAIANYFIKKLNNRLSLFESTQS
ncbi:hypothetical protein UFOVP112_177 [uncultured Caudovirales phage]|uniref:SGNH hydrolase-type esterase domain-containing protein n=1 Tax=uncultured Caudovirales phage TaxID=2100421 RepID=A0A6J5LBD6_9CAUD|nr:hypothetical protein UFOVP112_177 [uncultured Caudovirales phage]